MARPSNRRSGGQQRRGRQASRQAAPAPRTATVNVHYPKHVPVELRPIWDAAARRTAKAGKLLRKVRTASGEVKNAVDYYAVNDTYRRILAAYANIATEAQNPA